MEIPNVEQLLDYVFNPGEEDFSLSPSLQEYQKLKRIMGVMINFYKRGSATKKSQVEQIREEMEKLLTDEKMIIEQAKVLEQFPDFHPKKQEYSSGLDSELESLRNQKKLFTPREENFVKLFDWSLKIVATVEWLGKQLEAYCNEHLGTKLEVSMDPISVDDFRTYKRGLEEITFNLQESQDFFNASLDGRLQQFHQIEKCMIEAQLTVLRKYAEDNLRRMAVERELQADLEYVVDNMKENPQVTKHRERMRQMHQEFFAVLKWQREILLRLPFDNPSRLTGDVETLKKELIASKKQDDETTEQINEALKPGGRMGPFIPGNPHAAQRNGATSTSSHSMPNKEEQPKIDQCPVTGKKASSSTTSTTDKKEVSPTTTETKPNEDFTIHRLYEKGK